MIADVERRAALNGMSIRELCREAGVNTSTWTRWKSGLTTPTFATWGKIEAALPPDGAKEPTQ